MATEFNRTACQNRQPLRKSTLLAMLANQNNAFFNKLQDSNWEIVSFNPQLKQVCILLMNGEQNVTISVNLESV